MDNQVVELVSVACDGVLVASSCANHGLSSANATVAERSYWLWRA
jgi:hypothetical protein